MSLPASRRPRDDVGFGGIGALVLTVRFLAELAMLVAFGYWGFTAFDGAVAWIAGVGAPVLAAAVWGLLIAPKATRRLPPVLRLSVEIDLFVLTALALWAAGALPTGIVLGVTGVVTSVLNFALALRRG